MKETIQMRISRISAVAFAATASLAVAACGSSSNNSKSSGSDSSTGGSKTLVGAGSTLVAPLVDVWQPVYDTKFGVAITYGAIGSGGGIEQTTARTVNFGGSDAPMTSSQASACNCYEIPWALAGVGIAYHVAGVPNHLHFSGSVLAKIWMGQIKTWNDPAIKALNPGVNLPSTAIVPVHRTDGSGDTFAFTNYLSKVSPQFASKIGNATTVSWPGGIGGKGNSGVGGAMSSTNGAIAYITMAYVLANKFDYGLVQNLAGKYPTPQVSTILAAAAAQKAVPTGGTQGVSITQPPASAPDAYPISTFTYVLVPKNLSSNIATALKAFIGWALTDGQTYGPKLDFAPLPSNVVTAAKADLDLIK
jgi:phosphate transport system substrate-binding protein